MTAATADMSERMGYPWWLVLLEGIAALILGILFLTNTAMTLAIVVVFLGVWWLISGIFSLISIFTSKDDGVHWGWKLLKGVLGILAGVIVINHPLFSTILIPTTIVILLGIQGIIVGAIGLYQSFKGAGWGPGILGVLSILIGLFLLANPLLGALALPLVLGIFGIVGGIIAIWQSFQIRKLQE